MEIEGGAAVLAEPGGEDPTVVRGPLERLEGPRDSPLLRFLEVGPYPEHAPRARLAALAVAGDDKRRVALHCDVGLAASAGSDAFHGFLRKVDAELRTPS